MYYSNEEMFLCNSVGTLDWNVQKELDFEEETVHKDDTDARLIVVLGNLNKLQRAIQLADKVEGRTVSNEKIKKFTEVEGKRFAIPVNGDEDNLAIFEIKHAEENDGTGFNGAVIKCVKGGGEYNGKTIAWADGSKGWGNLFKIQSPAAFIKTVRELWNDWIVNDFCQIARNNPFNQFHDLVKMIKSYNNTTNNEDKIREEEPITFGIGASMMGIGMSLASYVKGFEGITFKAYSGCVSKDMLEGVRKKLSKMSKKPDWELNSSSNGKLETYTNPAEPLTMVHPPVQENNKIYLMKNCLKKFLNGHGGPAYYSSNKKPVEFMVSTHAKSPKNAEKPAVHKKSKGEPTGGAAPVKPEGSKKLSRGGKSDEDGHWITTKNGNKVFIEDEQPRIYPGLFIYDPIEICGYRRGASLFGSRTDEELLEYSRKGELMKNVDVNKYWNYETNPVSKVGVFEYLGSQIAEDLEPNKRYKVYRPAEEIASPEALKTLYLLPIIDDHQMLGFGDGLMPAEEKGVHGVLGDKAYIQDCYLYCNMRIFSEHLKDQINNGKRQLSMGYRCEYDRTPGTYNGMPYDMKQINIRYNHLALVTEGRMGADVCVMDSIIGLDAKGYVLPEEIDYGIPEVFYSNVSPEVLEVRNDPAMIAYLSRNKGD